MRLIEGPRVVSGYVPAASQLLTVPGPMPRLGNGSMTHSKLRQSDRLPAYVEPDALRGTLVAGAQRIARAPGFSGYLLNRLLIFKEVLSVSLALCRQMAWHAPFNGFPYLLTKARLTPGFSCIGVICVR
jgi:hypothetical protein